MRRHDWPERLAGAIAAAKPFSPESYCVLFAADCVEAMTGTDYAAEYRGLSLEEAQAKFRCEGCRSPYYKLMSIFGKPVPLAFAQRGDVIVQTEPAFALGICCGQRTAFVSSEHDMAYLPTLELRWAFRVA